MAKKKFPKKAKLVTDGGFYKFIKLDKPVIRIHLPLFQRIHISTPEINLDIPMTFEAEFSLEKVYKNYALYKQVNVIQKK
jgi:hypothetical protein